MKRLFKNLTFRVLVAVTIGVIFGLVDPEHAKAMKLLGDVFIRLVKMVIGPIVFLTIVLGIANIADMKKVGRVGGKAILYFEIVTTFALAIGLTVVNFTRPGAGLDVSAMAKGDISSYTAAGKAMTFSDFVVHVFPQSPVEAFVNGDILQIVVFSVLFGTAVVLLGSRGKPMVELAESGLQTMFGVVDIVMKVAPFGAFGAMAYTVGNFGLRTLVPLLRLMGDVYLTMFLFIFVVLNLIMRFYGFSLWQYLKYIKDELLIVLGTSSSEAALPLLMEKLERYGAPRPVVGLVVPTGYSFNLDGTSIYLSMATIFLAQVYNVPLSIGQQLTILAVLMVTSKGAAGVTGSGFIVLASTLSAMQVIPLEGLALLLGVDRFMSEARAITNIIGNGCATLIISRSEGAFDDAKRAATMAEIANAKRPAVAAGA
jgi:aerobic C4-dicarboxylate transport protein